MSDMTKNNSKPEGVELEIYQDDDNHTRNVKALYNRLNEMEWKMGEHIDIGKANANETAQLRAQLDLVRTLIFTQRAELENRVIEQERKIAALEQQLGGT